MTKTSETRMAKTQKLLLAGLFAALTGVCSWINIPLPFTPIPVNLALVGPAMAGLVLGWRYSMLSQVIYILMGAIGIPVFAGFTAGAGHIIGPTGGFLFGYILCAAICGLPSRLKNIPHRILLMICGFAACYICGLIWFMISMESTLLAGFTACVLPFLPGDAVKITLVAILSKYLHRFFYEP